MCHPVKFTQPHLLYLLGDLLRSKFTLRTSYVYVPPDGRSERHDGRDRRARGEKNYTDHGGGYIVTGFKEGLVLVGLLESASTKIPDRSFGHL